MNSEEFDLKAKNQGLPAGSTLFTETGSEYGTYKMPPILQIVNFIKV
ncbi:MAG: hypothetical protein GZ085_06130 [Sulfuriferula multivorans]|uniref:Uncharacterized protein n=1 Tax=Sulfuriferula multivorans TaxID=1559896 RepID=A0A7C9NQX1_9PROT|nr:hypothetical protein [Sulfuriferula multivorans]